MVSRLDLDLAGIDAGRGIDVGRWRVLMFDFLYWCECLVLMRVGGGYCCRSGHANTWNHIRSHCFVSCQFMKRQMLCENKCVCKHGCTLSGEWILINGAQNFRARILYEIYGSRTDRCSWTRTMTKVSTDICLRLFNFPTESLSATTFVIAPLALGRMLLRKFFLASICKTCSPPSKGCNRSAWQGIQGV